MFPLFSFFFVCVRIDSHAVNKNFTPRTEKEKKSQTTRLFHRPLCYSRVKDNIYDLFKCLGLSFLFLAYISVWKKGGKKNCCRNEIAVSSFDSFDIAPEGFWAGLCERAHVIYN